MAYVFIVEIQKAYLRRNKKRTFYLEAQTEQKKYASWLLVIACWLLLFMSKK